MTYTIDRVEYDQNEDQTLDRVKFRFANNEEPFDTFWVELLNWIYPQLVTEKASSGESELMHLFKQRIQHQRDTLTRMDAIEKAFLHKEVTIDG